MDWKLVDAFEKYCRKEDRLLPRDKLIDALNDCWKRVGAMDIKNLSERDLSQAEGTEINLDQFSELVQKRTHIEDWAATLALDRIFAFSLPSEVHASENILDSICTLTSEDTEMVLEKFTKCIRIALLQSIEDGKEIKLQRDRMQAQLSGKKIMNGGMVKQFHSALTDSLGWPSLDFFNKMDREHRAEHAPTVDDICPADEFDYARGAKTLPHHKTGGKRKIQKCSELMKTKTVKDSSLTEVEVIAIILYTGPMYRPYNTELRSSKERQCAPHYQTTIFVISSAIVKLTRAQNIPCGMVLFRGLGGDVDLPSHFYRSDSLGCKGFTEPGFMSTTKLRETAIHYSGLKEGKPFPVILEMHVRSVDRGADISAFSQYPHEAEFYWPPGCYLELLSQREELIKYKCKAGSLQQGLVSIFEVRVNCNLKTMTIDELLLTRKKIHLQTFAFLIRDVNTSLKDDNCLEKVRNRLAIDDTINFNSEGQYEGTPICTAESLVEKIVTQCREVREKHRETQLSQYTSVETYRKLVQDMLDTVTMANSKVWGWMEDRTRKTCFDYNLALRICYRERLSFLSQRKSVFLRTLPMDATRRQEQAAKLCIDLGLMDKAVDEMSELEEPRLVEAAAAGRPEQDVLLLLAARANVNCADKDGCTPLFAASRNGYLDLVKLLISEQGVVDAANKKGQTPVWIASRNSQVSCLELLIESKASIVQPDEDSACPLWVAAQYGRVEILKLLLQGREDDAVEFRSDVNAVDSDGCSPIFAAAHAGKMEAIKLLLEHRADANLASEGQHTPVMMAAQQGHADCLRLLLSAEGIRVDQQETEDGETALFAAAQEGHAECIKLLLEAGADVNIGNKEEVTPEQIAEQRGKHDCFELLRRARMAVGK
jgi:ankyrin repeat protein/uncharacterized protein YggL (DUF469 family)